MAERPPVPDWDTTTIPSTLELPPQAEKSSPAGFRWPPPPYATYPEAQDQTDPLGCEIVGLSGARSSGRLTFFVPEQSVAYVQIPPARTTMPLRFSDFLTLTLTTPIAPTGLAQGDPHSSMLAQLRPSPFRVALAGGGELRGESVGHVEKEFGLFLFPPADPSNAVAPQVRATPEATKGPLNGPGAAPGVPSQAGNPATGAVLRTFVPRAAYKSVSMGARIGEVLVEQKRATPQQVQKAADEQQVLRERKIGDILLVRQVVSPQQLLEAIDKQSRMPLVRIGEALLSLGLVTRLELDEALAQQQVDRNIPLGELLVRMGVVTTDDLRVALGRKMGFPLVNVDEFPLEVAALAKLSFAVASRLQVVPLLLRGGRLVVAIDDPARRRAALDEVEFVAQMKVVPVLVHSKSIDDVLLAAYEKVGADTGRYSGKGPTGQEFDAEGDDTGKLVETLEREGAVRSRNEVSGPVEQSSNSLVRLINNMIVEAYREGVSDIHIESYPGQEKIRIRFRKDGLMRTYLELPASYRKPLIARIKVMCGLDISEQRKGQDGKINFAKYSPQHKVELRVATIPTNSGLEDVVMRILASAKPIPMINLGLSEYNLKQLSRAVERPHGLVLCVGPTGSGKTTTLHSALSHINVPERKIWTVEDPIEITQPGLRQVQVNIKADWTFAKVLRSFLRADPDVIMLGEIRDGETAQMAVEASLTGHLVLSTLHTNSAPETVTRLIDMGVDPFNFADSLIAVLAQRLARRLCGECVTSVPATQDQIDELLTEYMQSFGVDEPPVTHAGVLADWTKRHAKDGRLRHFHTVGCPACDKSGYRGRLGLHELMTVTRDLRYLVQTNASPSALQKVAMQKGMRTLYQDGIDKVLAGHTSFEEVRATADV
ncbi:MAG: ATPase, T2SS/T4P/T4SS family [Burkholderiaceae bacterium]